MVSPRFAPSTLSANSVVAPTVKVLPLGRTRCGSSALSVEMFTKAKLWLFSPEGKSDIARSKLPRRPIDGESTCLPMAADE